MGDMVKVDLLSLGLDVDSPRPAPGPGPGPRWHRKTHPSGSADLVYGWSTSTPFLSPTTSSPSPPDSEEDPEEDTDTDPVDDPADIPTIIPSFEYEILHDAIVEPPWSIPYFRDGVGQDDSEDDDSQDDDVPTRKEGGGGGGNNHGRGSDPRGRDPRVSGPGGNGGLNADPLVFQPNGSARTTNRNNNQPTQQAVNEHQTLHYHRDQHVHQHRDLHQHGELYRHIHLHRDRPQTPLLVDYFSSSPGPELGYGRTGNGPSRGAVGGGSLIGASSKSTNGFVNRTRYTYGAVHDHHTQVKFVVNNNHYGTATHPHLPSIPKNNRASSPCLIDMPPSPSIRSLLNGLDDPVVSDLNLFNDHDLNPKPVPPPLACVDVPDDEDVSLSLLKTAKAEPAQCVKLDWDRIRAAISARAPASASASIQFTPSFPNSIPHGVALGLVPRPARAPFNRVLRNSQRTRPRPPQYTAREGTLVDIGDPPRPKATLNPRSIAFVPPPRPGPWS